MVSGYAIRIKPNKLKGNFFSFLTWKRIILHLLAVITQLRKEIFIGVAYGDLEEQCNLGKGIRCFLKVL